MPKKPTTLNLDSDTMDQVRALAKKIDRSHSWIVNRILDHNLRRYLEDDELL